MTLQNLKTIALGLSTAFVIAGTTGLTSTAAQAGVVVKPFATGVGFAHTRHRAKRLAVRAWERAVKRRYGIKFANFYNSRARSIRCSYIGYNRYRSAPYRSYRGGVYGSIGDVNAPFTCSARGKPTRFVNRPYPPQGNIKPFARGIGYAYSKAGAQGLAIRAWTNAVRRAYGPAYARFSRAARKNITCDYIGRGYRSYSRPHAKRYGGVIGQAGDVNAPWTCTAKGRPRY